MNKLKVKFPTSSLISYADKIIQDSNSKIKEIKELQQNGGRFPGGNPFVMPPGFERDEIQSNPSANPKN